jgi:hypothetical protein
MFSFLWGALLLLLRGALRGRLLLHTAIWCDWTAYPTGRGGCPIRTGMAFAATCESVQAARRSSSLAARMTAILANSRQQPAGGRGVPVSCARA